MKHWETIADNLSKAVGIGPVFQRSILTDDKSLLQTHIATTESALLCMPTKSSARFVELERQMLTVTVLYRINSCRFVPVSAIVYLTALGTAIVFAAAACGARRSHNILVDL